uniref:Secreted protein n=1 Tax=Salix viminalis TaxID=40686 RepID=A0A6N2KY24_SALVM
MGERERRRCEGGRELTLLLLAMRKVTVVAAASLPKAGFVLSQVFRNTMFGPEGRPQHCCAWLGGASSFSNCSRRGDPSTCYFSWQEGL